MLIAALLETLALYYGIYESHFLGLCTDFKVQHVDQMLSFVMYNEHVTSCELYIGNGNLKILLLHGMCMTTYKIFPSIYDICITGKSPPTSDGNCICFPMSDKNCICSPMSDKNCTCSPMSDKSCICSPTWDENCICSPSLDENCECSPTWDETYIKWNETCKCSHDKTCMIYCTSDVFILFYFIFHYVRYVRHMNIFESGI